MNHEKAIKYFKMAKNMAELFSKDPNTQVGCVLLGKESLHVLSVGYNGHVRQLKETPERWQRPLKYNYVVHSEANALYNACRSGVSTMGAVAVVTMFPCSECTKGLIQAGISKIITVRPDYTNQVWGERFKISMEMIEETGIELEFIETEEIKN